MSELGKGLGVLHLQLMRAKGAHPPITWMMHPLGKPKWSALLASLTMDQDDKSKKMKPHIKEKGKKRLRVATVGRPTYTPVKVPLSRDAHLQVMAVGLEAANGFLPSSLCADPMLPLAGMLTIF